MRRQASRAQLLKKRRIEQRNRMLAVEKHLLKGITSPAKISAALGIPYVTTQNTIQSVFVEWARCDPQIAKHKRARRVRQLENIAHEALIGFEKTKKNSQEVVTQYVRVKCRNCRGEGCGECEHKGQVLQENITTKEKGQAGDPAYLRVAKECYTAISELEGLKRPKIVNKKQTTKNTLKLSVNGNNPLANANRDQIIQARLLLEQIESN